jgi:hypothetical protein
VCYTPTGVTVCACRRIWRSTTGSSKRPAPSVTQALQEYIQRRRQSKILDLFGTIEFDAHWDYKKQRRRS